MVTTDVLVRVLLFSHAELVRRWLESPPPVRSRSPAWSSAHPREFHRYIQYRTHDRWASVCRYVQGLCDAMAPAVHSVVKYHRETDSSLYCRSEGESELSPSRPALAPMPYPDRGRCASSPARAALSYRPTLWWRTRTIGPMIQRR